MKERERERKKERKRQINKQTDERQWRKSRNLIEEGKEKKE